eukprot:5283952-Amphidinium_carterae.1
MESERQAAEVSEGQPAELPAAETAVKADHESKEATVSSKKRKREGEAHVPGENKLKQCAT